MISEPLRCGQLVYGRGGEILGRIAVAGAHTFLVDLGDIAVWLQMDSVGSVEPGSVHLRLAPSAVSKQY